MCAYHIGIPNTCICFILVCTNQTYVLMSFIDFNIPFTIMCVPVCIFFISHTRSLCWSFLTSKTHSNVALYSLGKNNHIAARYFILKLLNMSPSLFSKVPDSSLISNSSFVIPSIQLMPPDKNDFLYYEHWCFL